MQLMLAAALLAVPGPRPDVDGGRWVEVERLEDHTTLIDERSYDTSGTARGVWLRVDYASQSVDTGDRRTYFLMEIDCSGRMLTMLRYLGFDAQNNQTNDGFVSPENRRPGPIAPNTLGARLLELICR